VCVFSPELTAFQHQ